jgi:hypothetical protein
MVLARAGQWPTDTLDSESSLTVSDIESSNIYPNLAYSISMLRGRRYCIIRGRVVKSSVADPDTYPELVCTVRLLLDFTKSIPL